MKEEIANRIKELVEWKTKGNISAFARAAEVENATLHRWISAERKLPAEAAVKIAKAGGVTTDWLLTGEETNEHKPFAVHEHPNHYGQPKIDLEALKTCIKTVDAHLEKKGKTLSLDAKAQLIALLYEELLEQEKKEIREDKLDRYIDLAAA